MNSLAMVIVPRGALSLFRVVELGAHTFQSPDQLDLPIVMWMFLVLMRMKVASVHYLVEPYARSLSKVTMGARGPQMREARRMYRQRLTCLASGRAHSASPGSRILG